MATLADTCHTFVLPKLYAAGCTDEVICEQRTFTDGRIVVAGNRAWRRPKKRADRVRQQETVFFACVTPEARDILTDLLEGSAADGELQFTHPDVLKLPTISDRGNVREIVSRCDGAEQPRQVVSELERMLYAA